MNDDKKVDPNLWAATLKAEAENSQTKWLGMFATTIILGVFALVGYGCHVSYIPDPSAQQRILADQQVRLACLGKGGSWIPLIVKKYHDGSITTENSCVMPSGNQMVTQLEAQKK